ncbi:MAG: FAD-dependent oxidoreductase [Campylobacter sp.]|nr:FAD-dependent oxidoreductase [Campylobacter sp.]
MSSVVVVGSGIIGALNAYEMVKNGLEVTYIKQSDSENCSEILLGDDIFGGLLLELKSGFEANFDFLKWGAKKLLNNLDIGTQSREKLKILKSNLFNRSLDIYDDFGFEFSPHGGLELYSKTLKSRLASLRPGDKTRRLFEFTQSRDELGIFSAFNGGGVQNKNIGILDIKAFLEVVEGEILKLGVKVLSDDLLDIKFDNDKISEFLCKNASYTADDFVLCDVNPRIFSKLRVNFAIKQTWLYEASFLSEKLPQYPLFFVDEGISVLADKGKIRILCLNSNRQNVNEILNKLRFYMQDKELKELNFNQKLTFSSASLPIFGRDKNYDNLLYCFGFGSFGLSMAPSVAEILGNVVANGLKNNESEKILLYSALL